MCYSIFAQEDTRYLALPIVLKDNKQTIRAGRYVRTGTDKETRGDEYCRERTDFETCRKSVWFPERRERLVSPIGDRLRVTRDRVVRKRLSQADSRRGP